MEDAQEAFVAYQNAVAGKSDFDEIAVMLTHMGHITYDDARAALVDDFVSSFQRIALENRCNARVILDYWERRETRRKVALAAAAQLADLSLSGTQTA